MKIITCILLFPAITLVSCKVYRMKRDEVSNALRHSSDSQAISINSIFADLSNHAGEAGGTSLSVQTSKNEMVSTESRNIFNPHLEILQLVESFLKFKGQIGSRFYELLNDNYDLIRSVYLTIINKISNLHNFTLIGVKILRTLLEFAANLMAQWSTNLPSLFDLNFLQQQGQSNTKTIESFY